MEEPPPNNEAPNGAIPVDPEAFQKTQAQLEAIEQEIKETQPLTSDLVDISNALLPLYKNDDDTNQDSSSASSQQNRYFLMGIEELASTYDKMRKTRGDGNCYYRSFLYNLCETLLQNQTEKSRVIQYGTLYYVRARRRRMDDVVMIKSSSSSQ